MVLLSFDSEVANAIENEQKRQEDNINLIASENFAGCAHAKLTMG